MKTLFIIVSLGILFSLLSIFYSLSSPAGQYAYRPVMAAKGSICTPQDLDNIRNDLTGHYVQVCDIDLAGYDFQPIGSLVRCGSDGIPFTGTYDGNGHSIRNWNYQNPTRDTVGLFAYTINATLRNVRLINVNVSGHTCVGALIGKQKGGSVSWSFSSGHVNGTNIIGGLIGWVSSNGAAFESSIMRASSSAQVSGQMTTGGLIGRMEDAAATNVGQLSESRATGRVYGYRIAGGLVASVSGANVTNSWASGDVYAEGGAGGLVDAATRSTLRNCHASGNIIAGPRTQDAYVGELGGLVGVLTSATIVSCWASGNIMTSYDERVTDGLVGRDGGLVGQMWGSVINDSYATGSVDGLVWYDYIGGLVGLVGNSTIAHSYAMGNVSGRYNIGGLAGKHGDSDPDDTGGLIVDSYAGGSVSGTGSGVGGLVGEYVTPARIVNSYAIGRVQGSGYGWFGGLVGGSNDHHSGNITSSYWDINTTGQTQSDGGEGKTTVEMKQKNTFVNWNFVTVWDIVENITYPWLQ